MLQKRRAFNETCLLWCALSWALAPRHGQGAGQKPEWDGREQGDGPSYEVAQPPGPHPAGVCRGYGDSFCVGGYRRCDVNQCSCDAQVDSNMVNTHTHTHRSCGTIV